MPSKFDLVISLILLSKMIIVVNAGRSRNDVENKLLFPLCLNGHRRETGHPNYGD